MREKKLVRVFPMPCCKLWKTFVFDDFSHDGRMTLICHKHSEPVVKYITWKSGINQEEHDKAVTEYKKKKTEKVQPLANH